METNAYNQRPDALGLDLKCNQNGFMNLLSPIIYSPDEYFRNAFSTVHQQALASPLIQRSFQEQVLASPLVQRSIQQAIENHQHIQQQQHHPQQQQQLYQHQANQQQHLQQPQSELPREVATCQKEGLDGAPQDGAASVGPIPNATAVANTSDRPDISRKSRLTDEEKLRNKRERNRRAAANCRRRKDERLKQLEEENEKLRQEIQRLQDTVNMLRQANTEIKDNCHQVKAEVSERPCTLDVPMWQ